MRKLFVGVILLAGVISFAEPRITSTTSGTNLSVRHSITVEVPTSEEVKSGNEYCKAELNKVLQTIRARGTGVVTKNDCVWAYKNGKWQAEGTLVYTFNNEFAGDREMVAKCFQYAPQDKWIYCAAGMPEAFAR